MNSHAPKNEQEYKRYVKSYFILSFLAFCIPAVILTAMFYIADPLQLYHSSWFNPGRILPLQHEQMAGIINSHDFDSVILGTSMLQNSSAHEASSVLGGKFVNLSIAGSNFLERRLMLEKAADKPLKHVIFSLEPWYYLECARENLAYPRQYWDYLYDANPFNDIRIYFTPKYIFNPTQAGRHVSYNADTPFPWYIHETARPFFENLDIWAKTATLDNVMPKFINEMVPEAVKHYRTIPDDEKRPPAEEALQNSFRYVNEFVIEPVRRHSGLRFSFVLPPFSRFYYADLWHRDRENFNLHQEIVRYLTMELAKYKNAEIYGFEDSPLVDDMRNYRDYFHHLPTFNSWFIHSIATGAHKLTPENVEAYLTRGRKMAASYDLVAFQRQIEAHITRAREGASPGPREKEKSE